MVKKLTIRDLGRMKADRKKLTFITSYEYQTARLAQEAGIDMILVGDSAGNNMLGYENTHPVTMDEMIMLSSAARRGAPETFMVGDMPLGSYQISDGEAVRNALRFIKESHMDAVKCEGGERMAEKVRAMADAGIAVMGHIGYTPQSTNLAGVVRGKSVEMFKEIHRDATALQDAGAFSILLEAVPNYPAGEIARLMDIPIYGIGAGRDVDGVLAIVNDVIGLGIFKSKFVKHFCETGEVIQRGIEDYAGAIREGKFPGDEHLYPLGEDAKEEIKKYVGSLDH